MNELLEYFYCFLCVISITFCLYKYLDRKPSQLELVSFLLFYGFVNYIVTGKIQLDIQYKIFMNTFSMIIDYLCICLLNRKIKAHLFFYVTIYLTIYIQVIILLTYFLSYIDGFNMLVVYSHPIIRFIFVILFNAITIIIYKGLEKKAVLPNNETTKNNYTILCIINLIVLFVMTVFQWINELSQSNIYMHLTSSAFVVLWFVLIYVLNRSFQLSENKENQLVIQSIYSNIEQYIRQYKQEEEQIRKIRHYIKNHFIIIKNLSEDENIHQYIDEIYPKLENMQVLSQRITGNLYVDTILNSKKNEYPNITMAYHCNIEGLNMNSLDLSVLLFNLIDNACQASCKVNGYVHLMMKYDGEHLFIDIENSSQEKINFISKKGAGHGYGMKIINEIVEKYHGTIEYEVLDCLVNVKVGLILKE